MEHAKPQTAENPETGEISYPHMTSDGFPLLANGAVEGCGCDNCLQIWEAQAS